MFILYGILAPPDHIFLYSMIFFPVFPGTSWRWVFLFSCKDKNKQTNQNPVLTLSWWFENTEKWTLRNTVVMDTNMDTPHSSVNLIRNKYSFCWLFWNNSLSYFYEVKATGALCERMRACITDTVGDPPYSPLMIYCSHTWEISYHHFLQIKT